MKRIADREIRKKVPIDVTKGKTLRPTKSQDAELVLVQHGGFTIRVVWGVRRDGGFGLQGALQIRGPGEGRYKAIATDSAGQVISLFEPVTGVFLSLSELSPG